MKKVILVFLCFSVILLVSSCILFEQKLPTVTIPDQVINEGEVLSINLFDFIEEQKDESLFFVHIEGPGGIQGEKTFKFSPTYNDSGLWKVVVRLRNGKGKFTDVQFFIEVMDVNRSPIISVPNVETEEGDTVEIDFDDFSSDPDDDDLEFSLLKGEGSLNGSLYEFSPSFGNSGAHEVSVAVIDTKGASNTCDFIIEVKNVNRKPEISIPDQEVNEGDKLLLNLTEFASDPDFDTLSFSLFSEIGILETTKLIIEPNYAQSGSYSVTVGVSDGEAPMEFCTFTLTINDVNREPLAHIPDFAVKEGETLYINLLDYCHDPDGDKLTFEKESGVGDLQGSIYSYTPDYGVLKKLHELSSRTDEGASVDQEVMINVSDSKGSSVTDSFTVSVTDANRVPTLSIPDFSIDVGTTLGIDLMNYANDADNDGLAFFLIDGVGKIEGSEYIYGSNSEDEGEYEVIVEVKDEKGASGRDTFLITVRGSSKNLFLTLNDRIVHEDQNLTINLTDFTTGGSGNYLYELISGLGKVIGNTYTYSATTSEHGTWMVKIKVSDSSMNEYIDSFLVIVNRYPRFSEVTGWIGFYGGSIREGFQGEMDFSDFSEDPDGDEVTYSVFGLPGQLDDSIWSVSFGYEDAGEYEGILNVMDSKGASSELEISFVVREYNPPPVMEVPNQKVLENNELVINLSDFTFDHEGEAFEFYKTDEWNYYYPGIYQYCSLEDGIFTFRTNYDFVSRPYNTTESTPTRNYQFRIGVIDESGKSAEYWLHVTVENSNRPPNAPEPIFPLDNANGVGINNDLFWECLDQDGDLLSYDVYFGSNENDLKLIGESIETTQLSPGILEPSTEYFWKVFARDELGGLSESDIWSFSTSNIVIAWQNCLGGSQSEHIHQTIETADGGVVISGLTQSNDGDVTGYHGGDDIWVVKLSANGALEWQRCLGGSSWEDMFQTFETSDGGFLIAGVTNSNDGDVSDNHGETDIWIVKLTQTGNLQWQRCLGGSSWELTYQTIETADGGFVISGLTQSNDGDVTGYHGGDDIWVVKLAQNGALEWERCLGGSSWEVCLQTFETADGGFVITGLTQSNDGDIVGNHGDTDMWIVKLTPTGTLEWQRSLGGSFDEECYETFEALDGGYVITGRTFSADGDVSGNHGEVDIWVSKLAFDGILEWQRCFGGSLSDDPYQTLETSDGGFIIVGQTPSDDGDVSDNHGEFDIWVLKLAFNGTLEWQSCLGGSLSDYPQYLLKTQDGGYAILGRTYSDDGDVMGYHGESDIWVAKLTDDGTLEWQRCLGGSLSDFPLYLLKTLDGGYAILGRTYSDDGDVMGYHGESDIWVVKLTDDGTLEWQRCFGGSLSDYSYYLYEREENRFTIFGGTSSSDGDVYGFKGKSDIWSLEIVEY